MKAVRPLLLLILLLAAPGIRGQTLFYNTLGTDEGLTQLDNENIFEDSHGLLWIGSTDGLNCFDGNKIRAFRPDPTDSTALLDGNIQSRLIEDEASNLWFSTWEAVYCYVRSTDRFRRFRLTGPGDLPVVGYQLIWRDADGKFRVLVGQQHLYLFDPQNGHFEFQASFPVAGTWSVPFIIRAGELHVSMLFEETSNTMHFLEQQADNSFSHKKISLPFSLRDIARRNDTIAWVCGGHFLGKVNWEKGLFEKLVENPEINFFAFGRTPDERFLLVGTEKSGVHYFDKETGKLLDKNPFSGLPDAHFDKTVYSAIVEKNGNWAIHVPKEGVVFGNSRKQKFRSLLASQKIQAIAEDRSGHIWAANFASSLFEFSPENELLAVHSAGSAHPDSLAETKFRFLFFDRENRAWAGGWSGLRIKLPNQTRFRKCLTNGQTLLHGIQLLDGRLVFSSMGGGLFEAQKSTTAACGFQLEKVAAVKSDKAFTTLFQARNGLVYACRELTDIAVFDPNQDFRELLFLPISGEINHYYEPPGDDVLWISTSNGLVKLSQKDHSFETFNRKNGLPDAYVLAALPDTAGNLWLSTHRGVVRFSLRDHTFRQFIESDGLAGLEFNVFASARRGNGEIWFGGMGGISVFHPQKMPQMEPARFPLITAILINDQPAPGLVCQKTGASNPMEMKSVSLEHSQNTVSFRFSQPELGDPKHVRFEYKMTGVDENWVPCGPDATARYPNLPPDRYEFLVRGYNSDGIESLEMARLEVVVKPAFWQTGWFKFLVFVAFLSLIYGIYRYRLVHIRREFALSKNALENEKKALESTISALLAQMNPHFIFNSLNSINSFILQNRGPEASQYLHQFAGLMRQILDYSSMKTISLEQEIAFLNDYLAIESLRMSGRLAWKITLADDVDDFDTQIPPMILQPFVENAIWHGLSPKSDGGRIDIHFKKENGALLCSVEDNGVGRSAATANRAGKMHDSKALAITADRLRLFDEQKGGASLSAFKTIDLLDEKGQSLGTRVELRVGV